MCIAVILLRVIDPDLVFQPVTEDPEDYSTCPVRLYNIGNYFAVLISEKSLRMEPIILETNPAASAHTQGPPQAVSISSTLPNASPNGRASGGDNELQGNENETSSPTKDTGRTPRKNRLSVENLTCSSCGKVCSNKSKYMRHLSTHSEERPYSCPLCKKGFKWVEYLSKHMKQQHPNTALGELLLHI